MRLLCISHSSAHQPCLVAFVLVFLPPGYLRWGWWCVLNRGCQRPGWPLLIVMYLVMPSLYLILSSPPSSADQSVPLISQTPEINQSKKPQDFFSPHPLFVCLDGRPPDWHVVKVNPVKICSHKRLRRVERSTLGISSLQMGVFVAA